MLRIKELLAALWNQDFQTLSDPEIVLLLYAVLFAILVLENGFLPATFLPGDSLLLLTGTLAAHDIINFWKILGVLTLGALIGSELGYVQGRWLSETKTVKRWLSHIPRKYHNRTRAMLHKYGVLALLIARFTAFVRTMMPLFIGVSGMERRRFHIVNGISGFLWVGLLVSFSYFLSRTEFFQRYQSAVMTVLTVIPVILLVFGLLTSVYFVWKSRRERNA